jgi:L-iditol 2-dehydrogenase
MREPDKAASEPVLEVFVMVRRMHKTYAPAIAMATSGIDLDALVTARWSLEAVDAGFAAAASLAGDKTVITVSGA